MLFKKREFLVFIILLVNFGWSGVFFTFDPLTRARRYLELSLENYKKAIKENPSDVEVIEEYRKVLSAAIGELESNIELAILFYEIGFESETDKILLEIGLSKSKKSEAINYLEERIKLSKDIDEKIVLYQIALKLSPRNGLYWFSLGKIYFGLNRIDEGIAAMEKAYQLNVRDTDLFYYLANAYMYKGEFKKAEFYCNQGLNYQENILLHKLLYSIYRKQGKHQLAKKEKEKIDYLVSKKEKPEKEIIVVKEKEILPPYYFLVALKDTQKLYLYNFDGKRFKVIMEFDCTTGKNSGDKIREGDGRTPEGAYLLTRKIDGTQLPSKYGIVAYPLNYPDPIDIREKKDGNGIWFHATPIERPPYNSEGCIVINDSDMKKIIPYIRVKKTFICIFEKMPPFDPEIISEIKNTVQQWKKAWESKNIQDYISFYDEQFYSRGKNREEWKKYKARINKNKQYIKINITDLQILPYGNTKFGYLYVAFFYQDYRSSNFSGKTYKILYFVKRKNNWKILSENTIK